jgi:hypothetical protein
MVVVMVVVKGIVVVGCTKGGRRVLVTLGAKEGGEGVEMGVVMG